MSKTPVPVKDVISDPASELAIVRERIETYADKRIAQMSPEQRDAYFQEQDALAERNALLAECREIAAEFPPVYRRRVPLLKPIEAWLDEFLNDEARGDDWERGLRGLCLIGRPGCGKTQSVYEILARVLEIGYRDFAFIEVQGLIKDLQERSFAKRSDADILAPIISVDLLVLDDLGAVELTAFRESALLAVLDGRWKGMKPTIITTNIGAPDMSKAFGGRVASRIGGVCRLVTFPNVDLRQGGLDYSKGRRS